MKHQVRNLLKWGAGGNRSLKQVRGSLRIILAALLLATCNIATAGIVSPAPGSTLPGSSVVFSWDPISKATQYYLALGTSPDVLTRSPWSDLGFKVVSSGTSVNFLDLPQDGKPVYGRLWYVKSTGGLGYQDYSWSTDAGGQPDAPATLLSPLPPQTLANDTILSWDPGHGANKYMLMIASNAKTLASAPWADLFSWSGTETSVQLNGLLPTDGSTVYVRLWSQILGTWRYVDYTFQTEALQAATLSLPQAGTTIGNSSIDFQWGEVPGASEYIVGVGSSQAALEVDWGDIFVGSSTQNSLTAYNIPLNGRDIYVRLWTSLKGSWIYNDYRFSTQQVVPAALLLPATDQVLDKHAQRFAWTKGTDATEYLFAVASSPELLSGEPYGDIFTTSTTDNDIVATGLPLDGKPVYVRLWSLINDEWFHRDSVFQSVVDTSPPDPLQECNERGWQRVAASIGGNQRQLLVKANAGAWTKGVILLMHGGGGSYTNWCNSSFSYPQWQFANDAVKQGYAVLALDSTDHVVQDDVGQDCGKRFDAVRQAKDNVDLPFLSWVLDGLVPALRPAGSNQNVFVAGISNGGYMATRAATRFGDRITAFAPVAAGDPYGTEFYCDKNIGTRPEAPGTYLDRETGLSIANKYACLSSSYVNEMPWDSASGNANRPPFMLAYHMDDGIVDSSCKDKLNDQLIDHGYPDHSPVILTGGGLDPEAAHYWLPEYNQPILDFFNGF